MSEHARKRARAVLRGRDSGNIILLLDNSSGADLSGADLSGANLKGATVTQEQLAQAKSLKGTIMPDGTIHP